MEISNGLRKILSWSIFPVLMILSLVITLYALQQKWDPPSIMVAVSAGATVLIILFERLIHPQHNVNLVFEVHSSAIDYFSSLWLYEVVNLIAGGIGFYITERLLERVLRIKTAMHTDV